MIIQKKCFCGKKIKANGEIRFEELVESHFRIEHPEIFSNWIKVKDEANSELNQLINKYPKLIFTFNRFTLDVYNLLKKEL